MATVPTVYRGKSGKGRRITGVVRDEPDVQKIARAVGELVAKQQLESDEDQAIA